MVDTKTDKQNVDGRFSFMKSPYIHFDRIEEFDVVILGIPLESGTAFRKGQKQAPDILRDYSQIYQITGRKNYNFYTECFIKTNNIKIGDLGNLNYDTDNFNNENIIETISKVCDKAFPLILGGDHSITYPSFVGCMLSIKKRDLLPIGLLHFDAHVDTEGESLNLPRVHNGNIISQLINDGFVSGSNVISIGLRGFEGGQWIEYGMSHGITYYPMNVIRKQGIERVMNEVVKKFNTTCKSVYVSFDVDFLDPSQAPGTGYPAFGGMFVQEFQFIIPFLSQLPVEAFDLVEFSPPLDFSGVTALAICEILWQYLAFGKFKRK